MIQFKQTMDEHSRDILRDGVFIGFLQWHPTREPRVELMFTHHLTANEMQKCLDKLKEVNK